MELLSNKQIRMLQLLDGMISKCTKCDLYKNGRVKPYWTPMSIYGALGEAPGGDEVDANEPFVGKAGVILSESMAKKGFRKEQFFIINSVNCRPMIGNANGKPTFEQVKTCSNWIRKYVKVINPEKIIAFGNYARGSLNGRFSGIVKYNAHEEIHYGKRTLFSVHPAYCIYNKESGSKMLELSIIQFKNIRIN